MQVCLGGTFSIIHAGHEALLRRAFHVGDRVIIGLTSDELASRHGKDVPPYEKRKERLHRFIQDSCNGEAAQIIRLDDQYGPAATGACDAIVVSPETAPVANKINEVRRSNDIPPLRIIVVPYVLADDGIPISSTRISQGEITDGRRAIPLEVSIGTSNETKRTAAAEAFHHLLSHLDIHCTATPVETMETPRGEDIWKGALHRAQQSLDSADYGVGIEAGIIHRHQVAMLEHVCTVVDSAGYMTRGTGPAFQIPAGMTEELNDTDIGDLTPDGENLAGFLSDGAVTRRHLTREAVTAALLPRLRGRH